MLGRIVSCLVLGWAVLLPRVSVAQGGDPFLQDSGPEGWLVVEAESFHTASPAVTKGPAQWEVTTTPVGFSGAGGMQIEPDGTGPWKVGGFETQAPQLNFEFEATKTGTHYVWVRAHAPSTAKNSVHVGIDGNAFSSATKIQFPTSVSSYLWNSTGVHSVQISTLGPHTLNLWGRDKLTNVDQVVLTVDATVNLSGNDPALPESGRTGPGGGNTDPTAIDDTFAVLMDSAATPLDVLSNDFDTDSGDLLTIDSVGGTSSGGTATNGTSEITYQPMSGFSGQEIFSYTISDGNGGMATAMVTVNVNAPPSDDAFLQDGSGLLVVEAEHFHDSRSALVKGPADWVATPGPAMANGEGAMRVEPSSSGPWKTSTYSLDAPEISFDFEAATTGTHYVFVRGHAPSTSSNSVHIGLDGFAPSSAEKIEFVVDPDWVWNFRLHTIEIDTLGPHTLNLWPREKMTVVDQIVIKLDSSLPPSAGLPESPRAGSNVPPVAVDDDFTVPEESIAAPLDVLFNDNDPDSVVDPIITSIGTPSDGGTFVNNGTNLTYSPLLNFAGDETIDYTISDADGGMATATVTVTVTNVNDDPVAEDDGLTVPENPTGSANGYDVFVLANDTDVDPLDNLTVSAVTQGDQGGTVVNNVTEVNYTPAENFEGQETFTYDVTDGNNGTATGTVTMTVSGVNVDPVAVDDPDTVILEDSGAHNIDVLANDTDDNPEDVLTVLSVTQGTSGGVVNNGSDVTYTPNLNFAGGDTFQYTLGDGEGGTSVGTVTVDVTPDNDLPVAMDDTVDVPQNLAGTVLSHDVTVLANDSDVDSSDVLVVDSVTQGSRGGLVVDSDTHVTYTPAVDIEGAETFTYVVSDGNGGTAMATVTATITAVNFPPDAVDDPGAMVPEDSPAVAIDVLANDSDPNPLDMLTVSAVTQGSAGGTVQNNTVNVMYTPAQDFEGVETFTYTASDGQESDTATVTVNVTAENDDPVAVDDGYTVPENTVGTSQSHDLMVLVNDTDVDTDDVLMVSAVTQGNEGGTVVDNDTHVTYTPAENFEGEETFTYDVSDGNSGSATATVTVTISSVNLDPDAVDDPSTVIEEDVGPVSIDVLANDTDPNPEDLPLTISGVTQGDQGGVVVNNGSDVTYTSAQDFHGVETFSYTVDDGATGGDTALVTVTVTPTNDAPVAVDDSYSVPGNSTDNPLDVLNNDTDVDSSLTLTGVTNFSDGGSAVINGSSIDYTPLTGFSGFETFDYSVTDGTAPDVVATVTVNVLPFEAVFVQDSGPDGILAMEAESYDDLQTAVTNAPADWEATTTPSNFVGTGAMVVPDGPGRWKTSDYATTAPGVSYEFDATHTGTHYVWLRAAGPNTASNSVHVGLDDIAQPSGEDAGISVGTAHAWTFDVTIEISTLGRHRLNIWGRERRSAIDRIVLTVSNTYHPLDDGPDGPSESPRGAGTNRDPVAVDDTFQSQEDAVAVNLDVLVNDSDLDLNDVLMIGSVGASSAGSTIVNNGTDLTYTPAPGFVGDDTFSYVLVDGKGGMDNGDVTVTVENVNNPPMALDDSFINVPEDSLDFPLLVLANDTDADLPEGDFLLVQSVGIPDLGGTANNATFFVEYSPPANFVGTDTFTYVVQDNDGPLIDIATVTVTVDNVNDPPVAVDDGYTVLEDSVGNTLTVRDNDIEIDPGDVLTITDVSTPDFGGTAQIQAGTSILYSPDLDFFGTETFTYTVEDSSQVSSSAMVTVTVGDANDPPTAVDDALQVDVDSTSNELPVLFNDIDSNVGDVLSVLSIDTTGLLGSAAPNGTTVTYTPPAAFLGTETFTYLAQDSEGLTDMGTVTVTVVDRTGTSRLIQGADADNLLMMEAENFHDSRAATDGAQWQLNVVPVFFGDGSMSAQPSGTGPWKKVGYSQTAPELSYNVTMLQSGTHYARVRGRGPNTASNSVHLGVNGAELPGGGENITTVTGPNFAWTVDSHPINFPTPGDYVIQLWGREKLTDIDRIALTTTPSLSTTVLDQAPQSQSQGNLAPNAADDTLVVVEDSTGNALDVLANDTDPDVSDTLTVVAVGSGDNGGTVSIGPSGATVTYTPALNFVGKETFSYTVEDPFGLQGTAFVCVSVSNVVDDPVAVADAFTVTNLSLSNLLDVLANDTDPDFGSGDLLSLFSVGTTSAGGTAVISGGVVDYAPMPGFVGTETFDYTIQDSGGRMSTAQVTVTVDALDPITASLSGDFDDGNFFGWSVVDQGTLNAPSAWSVAGGAAIQTAPIFNSADGVVKKGTMLLYDGGYTWTDYTYSVKMTSDDDDSVGVVFRVKDENSYYRFAWDRQRNFRQLVRCIHGDCVLLYEDSVPYVQGQTYDIDVTVMGSTIELRIDSVLWLSIVDGGLASGSVGFYTRANSDSTFADVVVTSPSPSLRVVDATVHEGDASPTTASFVVELSPASASPVDVDFDTADGSATAGEDYVATSGVVSFAPGERIQTVSVQIEGDSADEGTEEFQLILSSPVGATLGDPVATGTILEADGLPLGLASRPTNAACVLPERPVTGNQVQLVDAFPDLPLAGGGAASMFQASGDSSRWFLTERKGRVFVFDNSPTVAAKSTFIDLRSEIIQDTGEWGILGFALHPEFASNRHAYISYAVGTNADPQNPLTLKISRFTSSDGGGTLDVGSEKSLFTLPAPGDIHMSCRMIFGPEQDEVPPKNYLYIGMGDFRNSPDADDPFLLPGSFLRIDVDGGDESTTFYGNPPDNPFVVGGGGAPEVYAYGFRNPWGWSFDSFNDELWVGDVGGQRREEIDVVFPGLHYGWPKLEGTFCVKQTGCDFATFEAPVADFERVDMHCVVGGYVYRGSAIPDLFGTFIYGDWAFNQVLALKFDGNGDPAPELLGETPSSVFSLAEDQADRELYVVTATKIFKIVPDAQSGPDPFPQLLSDFACVNPVDPSQPTGSMIPYEINVPFWSDGADKERWMALPDGTTITVETDGSWTFPIGTVLMKHFRLGGQLIETRVFARHDDGGWGGYTYEWDDQETDAALLPGSKIKTVQGQSWNFPSRGECLGCHTEAAGFVLGPQTRQLNRLMTYPSTGITADQLLTLEAIGMFTDPLPAAPADLQRLPLPNDVGQPLEARAKSYLHANCSHCHRPGHSIDSNFDARFDTPFDVSGMCDAVPVVEEEEIQLNDPRIIAPGNPTQSVLSVRTRSLVDSVKMPLLGKTGVDEVGADLLDQWITNMVTCPP